MLRALLKPLLVLLALAGMALPALAGDAQIVVYNKGKTLRYDPDVGAELKEIVLETYDVAEAKLVKKETIEAYFFLSDDKEIITPEAITDEARQKFIIEKKNEKYFFGGVRDKAITVEEANQAAPAPTKADAVNVLESKVKKISQEVVKIDPAKKGSSTAREKIINAEFTTALETFGEPELTDVAGFVLTDPKLNDNQKFYVLRSFGFTFYQKGLKSKGEADFKKAVFFYDKCIELDPTSSTAHYQKGAAYDKGGQPDDAIRSYVKALSLRPKENVTAALLKLAGATSATAKLDTSKIGELKAKVGDIDGALKAKDQKKATELANKLEDTVDGWYGSGGSGGTPKPPAPPATPEHAAPSPEGGENKPPAPATPGGDDGLDGPG